jgi:hypothetical protein
MCHVWQTCLTIEEWQAGWYAHPDNNAHAIPAHLQHIINAKNTASGVAAASVVSAGSDSGDMGNLCFTVWTCSTDEEWKRGWYAARKQGMAGAPSAMSPPSSGGQSQAPSKPMPPPADDPSVCTMREWTMEDDTKRTTGLDEVPRGGVSHVYKPDGCQLPPPPPPPPTQTAMEKYNAEHKDHVAQEDALMEEHGTLDPPPTPAPPPPCTDYSVRDTSNVPDDDEEGQAIGGDFSEVPMDQKQQIDENDDLHIEGSLPEGCVEADDE